MNLKNLVKSAGIGIKPHSTIEENKKVDLKRKQLDPSYVPKNQAPPLFFDSSVVNKEKTVPNSCKNKEGVQKRTQQEPPKGVQRGVQTPMGVQSVVHKGVQSVAQKGVQNVARKEISAQVLSNDMYVSKQQSLVAQKEVEAIKVSISEMADTEERKEYLKSLGIGIKVRRRHGRYYFYGIKRFDGRKEQFYCGSVL